MIILITAVPGSGKTLYAVGLIRDYLKNGRTVYADIDGLNIPGVLPAPDDWRDCVDGSVVVYDECQQRFGPDGAGRSQNDIIADLEVHRHRGFDIMLITQHPKLLHSHVRRLVGRHYHLFRMFGTQSAKIFQRDGQIDVDKASQLKAQDSFVWSYPKSDFDLYKSATVHTHKRQLPKWLIRGAIGIVVIVGLTGLLFYQSKGFWMGESAALAELDTSVKKVSAGSGDEKFIIHDDSEMAGTPYVKACIHNINSCLCYDLELKLLENLTFPECKDIATGPLRSL